MFLGSLLGMKPNPFWLPETGARQRGRTVPHDQFGREGIPAPSAAESSSDERSGRLPLPGLKAVCPRNWMRCQWTWRLRLSIPTEVVAGVLGGIVGGVVGVVVTPPIARWWHVHAGRQDAARFFESNLERIRDQLVAFEPRLLAASETKPETVVPLR